MSSLIVLQQRLFELHGISPSADRDAQIAVLFSDLHRLMQPPLSPVPALVLPRKEPLLSSSSSTIAPIDLALMPSPEALAPILPVFPSPTHPSAVLTPSSSVNGAFFIFYFILFYFLYLLFLFIYIYIYLCCDDFLLYVTREFPISISHVITLINAKYSVISHKSPPSPIILFPYISIQLDFSSPLLWKKDVLTISLEHSPLSLEASCFLSSVCVIFSSDFLSFFEFNY